MKLRSALLAATVLAAAPVAAQAQAVSGLYIGAGAGVNFMQDQRINQTRFPQVATVPLAATNLTGSRSVGMGPGFVGVVSVGYGLGNGLRLEIEGGYRQNRFKSVGGNGFVGSTGFSGDEYKYTGMVNALYDIDPAVFGLGPIPVVPYVGVGVGYAWAQHKNARILGYVPATTGVNVPFGQYQFRSNDGEGDFAYQGIAGVAFPIQAVPGLSLTAEYRFMGIAGERTYTYQFAANRPAPGVSTRATLRFNEDYNHSVMVGVRYAFNAAPPPPPAAPVAAAPAREAARTYLVFFDWDRADLTPRARQVVQEAAQATTRVQVTRIQVNGYTDTSGTPQYNQGLSVRRAQNVANELVRDGVPRGAISIQGFGETHLLVPTANGVREPQNRRVEIILQ
ncbi:MAG: OmpA family protein [Acetobacteraceae bacterium]|nr:OmpA family protein [Acetobacteraceae bacterium]